MSVTVRYFPLLTVTFRLVTDIAVGYSRLQALRNRYIPLHPVTPRYTSLHLVTNGLAAAPGLQARCVQ